MYWAGLVACMYSQVPGINFYKNCSPLVNNITFHALILMVIDFGYLAKIVNIETGFLSREFEEEIYMECHQGISDDGREY